MPRLVIGVADPVIGGSLRARAATLAAMGPDPFGAREVIVLDGGLATELERGGADLRDRLWSARLLIEQPEAIVQAHMAYFDAGADVAITASYQASFEGFAARGIDDEGAAVLMRRSVTLATHARDAWWERADATGDRPLVAASVGPYGAMLANGAEYTGDYGRTADELHDFHARRLEVLADPDAGADLLAVETIPSIVEAEALARALHAHPAMPAWVSFACRDDEHLCDGTPLADAVRTVARMANVMAVGVNCTAPAYVSSLVRIAADAAPGIRVLAYPNAGAAYDPDTKRWASDEAPPDPAGSAKAWVHAGASLVGGCCGTGPQDIRAIAAAIR